MKSIPTNVELKPWQNELMKYIKPHDREIIWVVGKDGNEGKNWFQKYVKSVYNFGGLGGHGPLVPWIRPWS